jgi:hypothetical protein
VKAEAWIFAACTIFLVVVTPAYWLITDANSPEGGDWTGTTALTMTTLLTLMVTIFLGFHARRMDPRPEDRSDAEIADGAGELGFFPPYSWWPLWSGLALATVTFAVAMGAWWLVIIAGILGMIAASGLIFEYYRGLHAH